MVFIIENITFSNKLTEVGVTLTLFARMKLYACRREATPRDNNDGYRASTMPSKHENMSLGYKSLDEILVSLFSCTLMSSTFT